MSTSTPDSVTFVLKDGAVTLPASEAKRLYYCKMIREMMAQKNSRKDDCDEEEDGFDTNALSYDEFRIQRDPVTKLYPDVPLMDPSGPLTVELFRHVLEYLRLVHVAGAEFPTDPSALTLSETFGQSWPAVWVPFAAFINGLVERKSIPGDEPGKPLVRYNVKIVVKLTAVAKYVNCLSLLHLCCAKLASMVKDTPPLEFLARVGIPMPSPEQERRHREMLMPLFRMKPEALFNGSKAS